MAATIRSLQDTYGNQVFPVTRSTAVFMSNNTPLETALQGKLNSSNVITSVDAAEAVAQAGYVVDARTMVQIFSSN